MSGKRCTLHKTKLEEFKTFLDSIGVAYRAGKGSYQVIQVQVPGSGWQIVFEKLEMPEHFSVNEKLMPLVREFLAFVPIIDGDRIEDLEAEVEELRKIIYEVHSWVVCAPIATPEDMAQNFGRIIEITSLPT